MGRVTMDCQRRPAQPEKARLGFASTSVTQEGILEVGVGNPRAGPTFLLDELLSPGRV
jgi:hypothetical protein